MPFQEFYCQSDGSNLNSGSTSGINPDFQYLYGIWHGGNSGWFQSLNGNPLSDGVIADQFASIYSSGATSTTFMGRIQHVVNSGIYIHSTSRLGTEPASGLANIRIGGAWRGPNGNDLWPFSYGGSGIGLIHGPDYLITRYNLRNDQNYLISTSFGASGVNGSGCIVQGYRNVPGDSGRAIIDGGVSGNSYTIWRFNSTKANVHLYDLEFRNNGASGDADGIRWNNPNHIVRCVFTGMRGCGIVMDTGRIFNSEIYNNNLSQKKDGGGMIAAGNIIMGNMNIHHNYGFGILASGGTPNLYHSVIHNNLGGGAETDQSLPNFFINSDFYNNNGNALRFRASSTSSLCSAIIRNCNFVKNNGYGILGSGSNDTVLFVEHCGFVDNVSGEIADVSIVIEKNNIRYNTNETPWRDPDNGDFTIVHPLAKGRGFASFTQTTDDFKGSVGYPDIGAAQHRPEEVQSTPIITKINNNATTRDAGSTINGIPRSS